MTVSPSAEFGMAVIINEVAYVSGSSEPLNLVEITLEFVRTISFRRGHFDHGAQLSLSDATQMLLYLYGGGPAPVCLDSVDTNDDGALNLSDPVRVLNMLFGSERVGSGFAWAQCGTDPTPDTLGCAEDICD